MRAGMIDFKNVWRERWSNPIQRTGIHNLHLGRSRRQPPVQRRAMVSDQVWTLMLVLQPHQELQMI
jgi:hypothetical protein